MREEDRALRAWLKVRGSIPGRIFVSRQKRPIDRTTLQLLMKKYRAAAGIPPELRRGRVQHWIGHASIQSTMKYAKVTNARRDDMAQQLKDTWR